ncbi:MAG: S8 family serine peptidase [Bacteroidota bacterium]
MKQFLVKVLCALQLVGFIFVALTVFTSFSQPEADPPMAEISQALTGDLRGDQYSWSFLSLSTCGVDQFLGEHPTYDGRGVLIIILDTGVDVGIPGLMKTSTGETKIIEVRDFSGEGDVPVEKAILNKDKGDSSIRLSAPDSSIKVTNVQKLPFKPANGVYYIGVFRETNFKNGAVNDFNGNGTSGDAFAVVAFQVALPKVEKDTVSDSMRSDSTQWVVYIDTNGNGDISDERPLRDYELNHDTFTFVSKPHKKQKDPLTLALNFYPPEDSGDGKVSIFFDDGGHGTHVAGIAAGYEINGQPGFNGVAPGAKIIALKIGNNTYSGGSTLTGSMKRAYLYAATLSKKYHMPTVINMSYGIGSEIAGHSDIDEFLDSLLTENEDLAICVSAGNNGPGISSIGTPAASQLVWTSGALFPRETARDAYGMEMLENRIFFFSSRGGDVPKPDAVAPGVAVSTVPHFAHGDRMNGTSMASPYSAGVMALLLSAVKQLHPDITLPFRLLKKALWYSAKPLPGYSMLDQGHGVLSVPAAFDLLKKLIDNNAIKETIDYEAFTESPIFPDNEGHTAYWRSVYFPHGELKQTFHVKGLYPEWMSEKEKQLFFRAFAIRSTADWLKPIEHLTYLRGSQLATVTVKYETAKLAKPGLYTGKILAFRRGAPKPIADVPEFELLNTIVVPYTFGPNNGYTLTLDDSLAGSGALKRYFIAVPPGATAMNVSIEALQGRECHLSAAFFFNPDGKKRGGTPPIETRDGILQSRSAIGGRGTELTPGIWEIDILSNLVIPTPSQYRITINFNGFTLNPSGITSLNEGGHRQTVLVTNTFSAPFTGSGVASISSFEREIIDTVRKGDRFTYAFRGDSLVSSVRFKIEMSREDYNKFTDVPVNIYNEQGKGVSRESLEEARGEISFTFSPGDTTLYTLEVMGAFTNYDRMTPFVVRIIESRVLKDPVPFSVTSGGSHLMTFYPDFPVVLDVSAKKPLPQPPFGYYLAGEVSVTDRNGNVGFVIPIRLMSR